MSCRKGVPYRTRSVRLLRQEHELWDARMGIQIGLLLSN